MSNGNDNNNDDFPFNDLFGTVEKIFQDFDRMFFGFAFPDSNSMPRENPFNSIPQQSKSLRDEVLKDDPSSSSKCSSLQHFLLFCFFFLFVSFDSNKFDENLDSTISEYGFDQALTKNKYSSSSSIKTRMERRLTPSGKCLIEKQIEESSDGNETTKKETISKICGENYHTTIKVNGQIQREYGNTSMEELDQIDSSSSSSDAEKFTKGYSEFFKKLFS